MSIQTGTATEGVIGVGGDPSLLKGSRTKKGDLAGRSILQICKDALSTFRLEVFQLIVRISSFVDKMSFIAKHKTRSHFAKGDKSATTADLDPEAKQLAGDCEGFSKREVRALRREIKEYIRSEGLFTDKTPAEVERYINRAISTYFSSKKHYAPRVIEWAHSLFETALSSNPPKRLVFLARDGIAPYEVAKKLKENYPDKYGNVELSLLYLSRKVVSDSDSQALLEEYARQEGLQDNEHCVFADIGFFGSMIDTIKGKLQNLTQNIDFTFFISVTPKSRGYMGDPNFELPAITWAGGNKAAHWLEDTHQNVFSSPHKLVRAADGRIYPNTINPDQAPETCKEKETESYLYKHFGFKCILDEVEKDARPTSFVKNLTSTPEEWRRVDVATQNAFNSFVERFKTGERTSYSGHF